MELQKINGLLQDKNITTNKGKVSDVSQQKFENIISNSLTGNASSISIELPSSTLEIYSLNPLQNNISKGSYEQKNDPTVNIIKDSVEQMTSKNESSMPSNVKETEKNKSVISTITKEIEKNEPTVLSNIQNVVKNVVKKTTSFDSLIASTADKYNLPVELLRKVIQTESNFNSKSVSPAGAQGLMQLMPATAKWLGVKNPLDPQQNIEGGSKYLRNMLDKYNGDVKLALAAYNAGPGNVDKYGGVPPFRETQNYVKKILS